jgi:hypothetical protein
MYFVFSREIKRVSNFYLEEKDNYTKRLFLWEFSGGKRQLIS